MIKKFEDETFKKMLQWSNSDNYFLRRLASEGSRAKLPWCQKINLDYRKPIAILDNLYQDKSRFVTRSVANHLNDIAKIDEDLVVETLEKWKKGKKAEDLDYIISHSTRTLVKAGHKKTLEFLGYSSSPEIDVNNFEIQTKQVKIGESLEFKFGIGILPFLKGTLTSLGHSKVPEGGGIRTKVHTENLIIDYKIYFVAKNGKLLPKVFKIKKVQNIIGSLEITKKHKLKIMSTKALYPGKHFVEIMINGKSFGKKSFELTQ